MIQVLDEGRAHAASAAAMTPLDITQQRLLNQRLVRTLFTQPDEVVRIERGEYTAAAYHFSRSGHEQRAVQVWFSQRRHARGEADAARLIFSGISRQRLDKSERTALDINPGRAP